MARTEKLSISIGKEDLKWLRRRARETGQTISAVLVEATRLLRQREARERLLKMFGDDAKVSSAEAAAIEGDWRG